MDISLGRNLLLLIFISTFNTDAWKFEKVKSRKSNMWQTDRLTDGQSEVQSCLARDLKGQFRNGRSVWEMEGRNENRSLTMGQTTIGKRFVAICKINHWKIQYAMADIRYTVSGLQITVYSAFHGLKSRILWLITVHWIWKFSFSKKRFCFVKLFDLC